MESVGQPAGSGSQKPEYFHGCDSLVAASQSACGDGKTSSPKRRVGDFQFARLERNRIPDGLRGLSSTKPATQQETHTETMKRLFKAAIALAFTAAFSARTNAQSLTSGLPTTELFRTAPGEAISGVEVDGTSLYYLLQRNAASTQLVRRSALDGFSTPTVLFDYGSGVFGSFVKEFGGKLYFGESSVGTLRTFDLGTNAVSTLATVGGVYDIDFSGGFGWLSANPGFAGNQLFKLDLTTGVAASILTSTDFSGPIAFGGTTLYYGSTSFATNPGIYRYNAAEINGGGLSLDLGHRWDINGGNAYFEMLEASPGFLARTDFAQVTIQDLITPGTATPIAFSADVIGNLASDFTGLYVSVTDYNGAPTSDDQSAIFRVVPEPGTAGLLGLALAVLGLRRNRK